MENEIEIMESVFAKNRERAGELNRYFTENGVFAINVLGAPGVGKTTSLIRLTQMLRRPSFIIEGDIESDIDFKTLSKLGIKSVQINTKGACHLDVPLIEKALENVELESGYLFIENIGNLICPAEFLIGEHIKILITCVTEGSDKPYKYPAAFEKSDIVLINKFDLSKYVDFDFDYYREGVVKLNPNAGIFKVSAKSGEGFDGVAEWILKKSPFAE